MQIPCGSIWKLRDVSGTVSRAAISPVPDLKESKGAVAHVTAPLLFVESKNKKHVFVKIKACATDFLENQKFSMDL